jgi:hypothetical protein
MKIFGVAILTTKEHEELRQKADAASAASAGLAWLTRLVEAHGVGEGVLDALRGQVEALKAELTSVKKKFAASATAAWQSAQSQQQYMNAQSAGWDTMAQSRDNPCYRWPSASEDLARAVLALSRLLRPLHHARWLRGDEHSTDGATGAECDR